MYSIMKTFWLLFLIDASFLKADQISVQFLNDQIENKIISSEKDKQLGKIGKLGKKMIWLGGFGLVSTVLIEMDDDDSDVGYIDPMEDNNNVDSNTYSILKIASLGLSASGLVLYFFDGGSFDDLVKPPSINFHSKGV